MRMKLGEAYDILRTSAMPAGEGESTYGSIASMMFRAAGHKTPRSQGVRTMTDRFWKRQQAWDQVDLTDMCDVVARRAQPKHTYISIPSILQARAAARSTRKCSGGSSFTCLLKQLSSIITEMYVH